VKKQPKMSRWLAAAALSLLVVALAACQAAPAAPASQTATSAASGETDSDKALTTPEASGAREASEASEASEAALPTRGASAGTPMAAPTAAPLVLEGAETTASGLQYLEENAGSGENPKAGEIVTIHYIVSLADGTELANTYSMNQPASIPWGDNRLLPGWEEGVGLMKPGGKAKMVLPPDLAFGEQGMGGIPPNSQIVIEMELLAVEAAPLPTEIEATELTKTESGLEYAEIKVGDGAEATAKSTVATLYTMWVKTDAGYKFVDQSAEGAPFSFVLGRGDAVFPGWDEGATGMKVGGKRLLVIPPALAMGDQENGVIPANSTLVMEIELTEVKEPQVPTAVEETDYTTTESGLKYYDLKAGTGDTPQAGQTVVVHYTGWLLDGTQFDSSIERGEPISFVLGQGNVIPGWDEGVATMKVGGKRQLVIPAALGYGDQGAGSVIPPGATLLFEVELLEVQ